MGDMNGHTGILGEKVDKNGDRLLNFVETSNLEILNRTIGERKVTWKGRCFESAIDYILVIQGARELVHEIVIDEDGLVDIDSDHNVLLLRYGVRVQWLGYNSWWNKEIDAAIKVRNKENGILRKISKLKKKGKVTEEEYVWCWDSYQKA